MKNNIKLNYLDMSVPKEDMLQLEIWDYIIDYWYYGDRYKLYVIKDYDWDNPVYCVEVDILDLISKLKNILGKINIDKNNINYIIGVLGKEISKIKPS